MFAKGKKTITVAYKEKLEADIAYYEKRIEEALLNLNKKHSYFEDDHSSDDDSIPYKLPGPSALEQRQEEESLSKRTSMCLELAMLTIMQSEVNIMATPPDVRKPVEEDGTWLEVQAECQIDLVSFTITFYAHKPYRRFAPVRYRNVQVTLVKSAHEKELAQSVLPKLDRPNLALQVLQSYATAFRSRRTTMLELAKKYADKLRMEALPEGGYKVRFLDLLTVDWTLENMWSPIVPFCHRMKFELEYMPKDYIHAIGKLYKRFKDQSLETSERTLVLSKIFDTCLEAQGPARDLREGLESDPETAGSLHERRTTIDQEPDVPNVSPQKQRKGKENKAQNRKTAMAPPKGVPKKAKKVANGKKTKANEDNMIVDRDVSKGSKSSDDKVVENVDASKENSLKDGRDNAESRKGVKRGIDDTDNNNAKKIRTVDKPKSKNKVKDTAKTAEYSSRNSNEVPSVSSKSNATKHNGNVANSEKSAHVTSVSSKNGVPEQDGKTTSRNSNQSQDVNTKKKSNVTKKVVNAKNLKINDTDKVESAKNDVQETDGKPKATRTKSLTSLKSKESSSKNTGTKDDINLKTKETNEGSKSNAQKEVDLENDKVTLNKVTSKNKNEKVGGKVIASSNNLNSKNVASSENVVERNVLKDVDKVADVTKAKKIVGKTSDKEVIKTDSNKLTKSKAVKSSVKNAFKSDKTTDNDKNQVPDQTKVNKITEKNKKTAESNSEVVTEKQTDKTKETMQNQVVKNKIVQKSDRENVQKIKTKESIQNKVTKQSNDQNKNANNDNMKKLSVGSIQKAKAVISKGSTVRGKISIGNKPDSNAKTTPRDETIEKAVTNSAKITKPNDKRNQKVVDKVQKPVLSKTTKPQAGKLSKNAENQEKVLDKLKTKIPIMKKSQVPSIGKWGDKNADKIRSDVEKKTKIPLKSLPVFKKSVKNLPTRISPRKLPSTLIPGSRGLFNK